MLRVSEFYKALYNFKDDRELEVVRNRTVNNNILNYIDSLREGTGFADCDIPVRLSREKPYFFSSIYENNIIQITATDINYLLRMI